MYSLFCKDYSFNLYKSSLFSVVNYSFKLHKFAIFIFYASI